MSYVLDALRKSEMERQMKSGPVASVLHPVYVESERDWRESIRWLAGAGLALPVVLLIGWLWLQFPGADKKPPAVAPATSSSAAPVVVQTEQAAKSPPAPPPEPHEQTAALPRIMEKPVQQPEALITTRKKDVATVVANTAAKPASTTSTPIAEKTETLTELPPKDAPSISISGYIRDDDGNSLAMINEKLVHEGEEVEPGLRLEKILGETSVFSYKGHRFRK